MFSFIVGTGASARRVYAPLGPIYYHTEILRIYPLPELLAQYYITVLPDEDLTSSPDKPYAFSWLWSCLTGIERPVSLLTMRQWLLVWFYIQRLRVPLSSTIVEHWFRGLTNLIRDDRQLAADKDLITTICTTPGMAIYNIPFYTGNSTLLHTTALDRKLALPLPLSITSLIRSTIPVVLTDPPATTQMIVVISHPWLDHRVIIKPTIVSLPLAILTGLPPLPPLPAQILYITVPKGERGEEMILLKGGDSVYFIKGDLPLPNNTPVNISTYEAADDYSLCVNYDDLQLRYRQRFIGPIIKAEIDDELKMQMRSNVTSTRLARVTRPELQVDAGTSDFLASTPSGGSVMWSLGSNNFRVYCYPTVVASRSPYVYTAASFGDFDISKLTDIHLLRETDVNREELWPLMFVWAYLNGYDDGIIITLNSAALRVWYYITYFQIPLTSAFVNRYLLRLFYLVDTSGKGAYDYAFGLYSELYGLINKIPLATKKEMVLFNGYITPAYSSSVVDRVLTWLLDHLRYRDTKKIPLLPSFTTQYLGWVPIPDNEARIGDAVMIKISNGAKDFSNSVPYLFILNSTNNRTGELSIGAIYNINGRVRSDTVIKRAHQSWLLTFRSWWGVKTWTLLVQQGDSPITIAYLPRNPEEQTPDNLGVVILRRPG